MAKTVLSVSSSPTNLLAAARERHSQLTAELDSINSLLSALSGETAEPTTRTHKRGRPSKTSTRRRGRPAGAKAPRKAASGSGKRGRPKGSTNGGMSLLRAVATVLAEANEPLKVSDIADAVGKLGIKSSAASFKTMISQTLGKLSEAKVAESTERGIWQSANGITKFLESFAKIDEPSKTDNIPI